MNEKADSVDEVYYSAQARSVIRATRTHGGLRLFCRARGKPHFGELRPPHLGESTIIEVKVAQRAPLLVALIGKGVDSAPELWSFDLLREAWSKVALPESSYEATALWPVRLSSISDYGVSLDLVIAMKLRSRAAGDASTDCFLCRFDLTTLSLSIIAPLGDHAV